MMTLFSVIQHRLSGVGTLLLNSSYSNILIAVSILLLTWYLGSLLFANRRNYPPGPFQLPLVGNLFLLLFYPKSIKLARILQKIYGNIVALSPGWPSRASVVLSSPDVIEEAMFAMNSASGRPYVDHPHEAIEGVKIGLTAAKFDKARNIRRWILKVMKNFGVFDGSAVVKVDEELNEFLDQVEMNSNLPWNPRRHLMLSVGAITHRLLFGRRPLPRQSASYLSNMANCIDNSNDNYVSPFFSPSMSFFRSASGAELQLQKIMEKVVRQELENFRFDQAMALTATKFEQVKHNAATTSAPSVMETPAPGLTSTDELLTAGRRASKEITEMFEKSRADDFISYYLAQEKAGRAIDVATFSRILTDLFMWSLSTVPDQILWALFYLAHMADEQERIHEEIIKNIKEGYLPGRSDLHRLTRTEAFLAETLRHSSMNPLIFGGISNRDFTLKGFTIPSDTLVWYSAYSCHYDRDYWGDPENFRVDRWLTPEGRLVNHSSFTTSFGIGHRICPGEHLGRLIAFTYIVGIVQNYQIRLAKPLSFNKANSGFIRRVTDEAQLVFEKRILPEEMAAQQLFE